MSGAAGDGTVLRFGLFELDLARGELRRRGSRLRLQQQPLKVLASLARRPGEVVSREELRREVWPEGTFVDFDRGLNFCINRIRRTLGEEASAPRYVETIPRRGYRFIAPVTAVAPATVATPLTSATGLRRIALASSLILALLMAPEDAGTRRPADSLPRGPARAPYLRGLYQARTAAGGPVSLGAFLEAARLDPTSPAAAAAVAEAWVREVREGTVAPRDGMPRARDAAARAVTLGDDPRGHLVLAIVALRYDWDWAAAERGLRRSLALDPASAEAHLELADLLLVRGRPDEAIREVQRAEELDPVCPTVRGQVASVYYAARRFDEAVEGWRRSAAIAPGLVGAHERLFHAYRHTSRDGDALREVSEVLSILGLAPRPANQPSQRAMTAFMRGTIEYLRRDADHAPALFAARIAVLHAALGEREDALHWLEVAARERSLALPVTLATDPDLDTLRADPSLQGLLRELSLSPAGAQRPVSG